MPISSRAGPEAPLRPIRGVILDVGNVLLRLRPIRLDRGRPGEEVPVDLYTDPLSRLRADPVLERLEKGQATDAEFFDAVRRLFRTDLPDAEIQAAYLSILGEPMPGMAELVRDLKSRGLRVVGLSDISPGHLKLLNRYPAVALLEQVIASCVTGYRKPEPGSYRAALEALGTAPGETLFVDDRAENVAGAAALGIQAVVFTTPSALRERLGLTKP